MILITGGLGYIGSHTVVELVAQGKEVLIVDDLSNSTVQVLEGIKKITGRSIDFLQLDLKEESKVKQLFETYPSIEGIIHFAAAKSVEESVKNPVKYYQNNVGAMLNLLAHLKPNVNFIFSSSCTVYGDADKLPISEEAPLKRPKSPYGNTKKICEEILAEFTQSNPNLKSISLRYFNPVGAHESGHIGENPKGVPQNLIPYITQSAIGKIPSLTVYGNDYPTADGTCVRDYIHVVDLARAHIAAFDYLNNKKNSTQYDVFNVGTGKGYSVLKVIERFEHVTGVKLDYRIGSRRNGDIISAYANAEKALIHLDWASKYTLDDAIRTAWNWEKKIHLANN